MKNLFFLALAGSMGAITRHLLFLLFAKITYIKFPLGTMFVNVLGSFLIGVAYVYISSKPHLSETLKLIIVIGFLGSFTTFSTFHAMESSITLEMRRDWFIPMWITTW